MGPPWAFNAGDVAYIHSDETHDLSFTALRLSEKFGLDIDTIPYGCRRNVSLNSAFFWGVSLFAFHCAYPRSSAWTLTPSPTAAAAT